jgi:hypothetical protein
MGEKHLVAAVSLLGFRVYSKWNVKFWMLLFKENALLEANLNKFNAYIACPILKADKVKTIRDSVEAFHQLAMMSLRDGNVFVAIYKKVLFYCLCLYISWSP